MFTRKSRQTWRRVAIDLLEHHESRLGRWMGYVLAFLIVLSVIFFVLETTEIRDYMLWGKPAIIYFFYFDWALAAIFTVEYIGRFFLSPNKTKFVLSPLAIIDLLVVLTFYLSIHYLSILRGFRVFKIFELLKIIRYSETLGSFFRSFHRYKNEFYIFWIMFSLTILLSSTLLYAFEHNVNPAIDSLPDGLWWAVVTITTVGYGDTVPMTIGGKLVASCVMVMGLAIMAILTAVITKIFMDHFFGRRYHVCLQCNYPHHDFDASYCKNCGSKLDIGVKVIEHKTITETEVEEVLAEGGNGVMKNEK